MIDQKSKRMQYIYISLQHSTVNFVENRDWSEQKKNAIYIANDASRGNEILFIYLMANILQCNIFVHVFLPHLFPIKKPVQNFISTLSLPFLFYFPLSSSSDQQLWHWCYQSSFVPKQGESAVQQQVHFEMDTMHRPLHLLSEAQNWGLLQHQEQELLLEDIPVPRHKLIHLKEHPTSHHLRGLSTHLLVLFL